MRTGIQASERADTSINRPQTLNLSPQKPHSYAKPLTSSIEYRIVAYHPVTSETLNPPPCHNRRHPES